MNLRVNRFFDFILYLLLVLVLFSCKESKQIGKEVQPAGNGLDVFFVDSFNIKTSTVLIDSANTRFAQFLFFGSYTDPEIGNITSNAYTQLYLANNNMTFEANSIADSVVINILGFSYYYGDTTKAMNLEVYRPLNPIDTSVDYTSKSVLELESTPMASLTFIPKVRKTTDTLKIKLNTTLGSEIVAASGTSSLANSHNFNQLVKGIVFKTPSNDGAILGISSNGVNGSRGRAYTRLFYHVDGESTKRFKDFYFSTSNFRFNTVQSIFSGSLSQLQKTGDSLPSSLSSNKCFIQPNVGLGTKIQINGLDNLIAQKGKIVITKADLEYQSSSELIKPGQYKYLPPGSLCLYHTDKTNKLLKNSNGTILRVQQEFQSNVTTPSLASYMDTSYLQVIHQITSYVQDLVYDPNAKNIPLIIYPLSFSNTFNRYVLFDNNFSSKPMKLKVYYTKID